MAKDKDRKDLYRQIKEDFEDLQAVLNIKTPYIASLLGRVRVVLDENVEKLDVSERGELRIDPDFYESLSPRERLFMLAHGTVHIALEHHKRIRNVEDPDAFNKAADAVVQSLLKEEGFSAQDMTSDSFNPINPAALAQVLKKTVKDLESMAAEEIYADLVSSNNQMPNAKNYRDVVQSGGGDSEKGDGQPSYILQEGDPDLYGEDGEKSWQDIVDDADMKNQKAGKDPAGLDRQIKELVHSKIKWKELLKKAQMQGMGRKVLSTWKRPSRRHPDMPGTKRFVIPTVWLLTDTSGSIQGKILNRFLSEGLAISKGVARVVVIPWDTVAYPEIEMRRPSDISKVIKHIKGGGGTAIGPALSTVLSKMRPYDIVVILTDGDIYDLHTYAPNGTLPNQDTMKLFKLVSAKASSSIFVTIRTMPNIPGRWTRIKTDL